MIQLQPLLGAVTMDAKVIHPNLPFLTNSMLVALFVTVLITIFIRLATRNIETVPSGKQNALELIIAGLYDMVEGMLGKNLAPRAFAILGAIFIFILVANYTGLMPGVGTIGWGYNPETAAEVTGYSEAQLEEMGYETEGPFVVKTPLIRPPTTDLNMNFAMALTFMVLWLIWSIQETGVKGFLSHIFGVKGGLEGAMRYLLMPLFFFVGLIEVISIAFRPVSLSLRLYGNVYAGENLLHTMAYMGFELGLPEPIAWVMACILPLPFYFLELLVGLLQAGVFMILCTVYLMLSTAHDEEEH